MEYINEIYESIKTYRNFINIPRTMKIRQGWHHPEDNQILADFGKIIPDITTASFEEMEDFYKQAGSVHCILYNEAQIDHPESCPQNIGCLTQDICNTVRMLMFERFPEWAHAKKLEEEEATLAEQKRRADLEERLRLSAIKREEECDAFWQNYFENYFRQKELETQSEQTQAQQTQEVM